MLGAYVDQLKLDVYLHDIDSDGAVPQPACAVHGALQGARYKHMHSSRG